MSRLENLINIIIRQTRKPGKDTFLSQGEEEKRRKKALIPKTTCGNLRSTNSLDTFLKGDFTGELILTEIPYLCNELILALKRASNVT